MGKASVYDWCRIISGVEKSTGRTVLDIAVERDVDVSTVRYWKVRGCPRYDDGEWLVNEYVQAFGAPPPKKT